MIGGQGEKKTLRLMAQHAEMANFTSGFDEIPRKLEVLQQHCADVGRDPATINKTLVHLEHLGIVSELTARRRGRIFSYARYVDLLNAESLSPESESSSRRRERRPRRKA